MWEERFDAIDGRLDRLEKGQTELRGAVSRLETGQTELQHTVATVETGQAELQRTVATLETGQTELQRTVARLETGQTELRGTVTRLETGHAELRGEIGRLDNRVDTLDRHMHVLHEETINRIAGISEWPWATKADINRVVDKIDELVDRRIVPLEVAVRSLSRERKARGPRRG